MSQPARTGFSIVVRTAQAALVVWMATGPFDRGVAFGQSAGEPGALAAQAAAQSGEEEVDAVEIVRRRLAEIQQAGPAHLERDAQGRMTPAAIEASLARLSSVGGGEEERAIAELAAQGQAAVEAIARRFEGGEWSNVRLHRSISVLHAIDTPESRDVLRRIAMDASADLNPNTQAWAAGRLVDRDVEAAWELLTSETPDVISAALAALRERPYDRDQLALLVEVSRHENWNLRFRAADLVVEGSEGPSAQEALAVVGRLLAEIKDHPEGDVVIPSRFGSIPHTTAENYYQWSARQMFRLKVDDEALRMIVPRHEGPARDAIHFALAHRGDASVRERMIELLADPASHMNRIEAAGALGRIGTEADLVLLRRVAESDPYDLGAPARRGSDQPPQFPVRQAASGALVDLQRRLAAP
jgi:hypothetical protein